MAITNKTILRIGSKEKDNIKILQQKLKGLGYYKGKVDGSFGPVTRAAVILYQKAKKLVQDGIAGPITLKSLGLLPVTPISNKVKTTVSTVTKGTIQTAIEKKLGTFSNFTGFYNKMIGRGYKHESGDTETLSQELSDLADFNCSNATQVGVKLAREMGYTARFVHVICKKSGGHIYGEIKGKEFGSNWKKFDLAAAMSVGTKAPLGTGWCFDVTPISYNDAWLESDDGKT